MKMLIQIASVFTLLYRGLLQVVRVVASRTQVASWSARDRQKGASALEYIMLAAVIVGLLVALALAYSGENENPIVKFFDDLFTKAENPGATD